jgi:Domain of unknown function (DUF6089)
LLPVLTSHIKSGIGSLWVVVLLTAHSAYGQKYFSGRNESGLVGGISNYHGDLSHGINPKGFKPSAGVYYKYNMSSYFAYRLQLSYLKIQGTDEGDPNYAARNLSFQTEIWELGSIFEFNFQPFGTNYGDETWTPYFFTGINGFLFEPTRLDNTDIKLRDLRTEAQKRKYSGFQPSVPIGFGIKAMSNPKKQKGVWIFGIEGSWRKTFTDNLDDVNDVYPDYKTMIDKQNIASAQNSHAEVENGTTPYQSGTMRGDTHLKDWYYFVGFTLAYRFTPGVCARFK